MIKIILTIVVSAFIFGGMFYLCHLVEEGKKSGAINHNYVGLEDDSNETHDS